MHFFYLAFLQIFIFFLTLPSEAKWIWAQQQNLKSFEKSQISSDRLPSYFAKASQEALKTEPAVLSVYGANFREFVFEVPDRVATMEALSPLLDRVYGKIGAAFSTVVKESPDHSPWPNWLKHSSALGFGDSPQEAFINLKLNGFQMTYSEWKTGAKDLCRFLIKLAAEKKIPWANLLEASRRHGRDPSAMAIWLQSQGLESRMGPMISEYGRLLTLADYLDPREFRSPEREILKLEQDASWQRLLIIDVKGLGATNREAQDDWLAKGADINSINQVSIPGTRRLQRIRSQIQNLLQNIPSGLFVGSYELGDSIVIGLRHLNDLKTRALMRAVESSSEFHWALADRQQQTLQATLNRAASNLKASKSPRCIALFAI